MLPFTNEDAVAVLMKAPNLNSALKNFLKREIKAGDPAGRFIKDLKSLSSSIQIKPFEDYVAQSRPAFDNHLLVIGKYAQVDQVNNIVGLIVEQYAEDFNSSYQTEELAEGAQKIAVTDKPKFEKIVKAAVDIISKEQATAGYPDSNFFKNLVLLSVFDRPVLDHILAQGFVK